MADAPLTAPCDSRTVAEERPHPPDVLARAVRRSGRPHVPVVVAGLLTVVAASVAVFGAAGFTPVGAQPSTPCWDISGTWHTLQGGSRAIEFVFSQSGSSVTGTADDGAGLNGTFSGNVTGNQVDVIVTWNFQKSDGSTLEGEYEATISQGTLSGSTHDVSDPSSKATWTASGGPTKDCSTSGGSNPSAELPADPEEGLLNALSGYTDSGAVKEAIARIKNINEATSNSKVLARDFRDKFPADSELVGFVQAAGLVAGARSANGKYTFPAVHALLPVALKMFAHAANDPASDEADMYRTAARRLIALAMGDALKFAR